jgi:hypothetical protein
MTDLARVAAFVLALALPLLSGCDSGPPMGDVSGTVTVDGQTPAAGSSINFLPADGKCPSSGCVIENGKYSARVPVGPVKVQVRCPKPINNSKPKPKGGYQREGETIMESLPAKYNDSTELTLDVKQGSNEKNWDLKTK